MSTSTRRTPLLAWALFAWALLAALTLWHALTFVGRPHPGFTATANMQVGAIRLASWTGARAGVATHAEVLAADGRPVRSPGELYAVAARHPAGTPIAYTFREADGAVRTRPVPSVAFGWADFTAIFLFWWLGGLAHVAIGALVVALRPDDPAARAHWWFCQVMGFLLMANFQSGHGGQLSPLWFGALGLVVPACAALGLAFPAPAGGPRLRRGLMVGAWTVAIAMVAAFALAFPQPAWWPVVHRGVLAAAALAVLALIGRWAWLAVSPWAGRAVRVQAGIVTAGLVAAVGPMILGALAPGVSRSLFQGFSVTEFTFALFPATVGWAIARHELFGLRRVVRLAAAHGLAIGTLAALYFGVSALATHALAGWLPPIAGVAPAGFVAALAVAAAFQPVYRAVRRAVDRLFIGPRTGALATLATLSERLPALGPAPEAELLDHFQAALQPAWMRLTLDGRPAAVRGEPDDAPALTYDLVAEGERLGSLAIGPRANGWPYEPDEVVLIQLVAAQAATHALNRRLARRQLELEVRAELAGRLAAERQQVLQQVVHDLRTDLMNLDVASALVQRDPANPRPIASIERSVRRMEALLAEKIRLVLEGRAPARTAVRPVVAEAVAALGAEVAARGQRVVLALAEDLPEVPLSGVELRQVVENLLGNACKFAPPGTCIRLAAVAGEADVRLRVADEGPGIPAAVLAAGPGAGARADAAAPGHGLGLANVRALVAGAGGALSWWNDPAGGAVVEAALPRV